MTQWEGFPTRWRSLVTELTRDAAAELIAAEVARQISSMTIPPSSYPEAHRAFIEERMRKAVERKKLAADVRKSLVQWGIGLLPIYFVVKWSEGPPEWLARLVSG